ncbi:hypothetical protein F5Y04DRAFT_86027 [Hypomontagnella monticulosa]|nr:hypothetical protein F5Y04DRAFT_86027 [Hypomontagnella monticulosa]
MHYVYFIIATLASVALGAVVQNAPESKAALSTSVKRTPAIEKAGEWEDDDDDAIAYAWYEDEGDEQN